jgi:hypothetical protein
MPVHDWTRADAGDFHDFHQDWSIQIRRALNAGILPPGYYAQAAKKILGFEPDVVTSIRTASPNGAGGMAVADRPPRVRQAARIECEVATYARKADRIVVRDQSKRVVSVIEIVSPGNKNSKHAIRSFTEKVSEFLRAGVHVQIIDLFPPTPRDPDGIHEAILEELGGEWPEARPADKPLTVASYDAGDGVTAYVEPLAVGDRLPDMPLFLSPGYYVSTPLEATYQASWDALPGVIRDEIAPPA